MNYAQYSRINKIVAQAYSQDKKWGIHNYEHTKRVEQNTLMLKALVERFYSIDEYLLRACALLHDTAYCYEKPGIINYFREGKLAKKYVEKLLKDTDIPTDELEIIQRAVYRHPMSFPFHRLNKKDDIYTKLLQDADTLDMFSAERLLEKYANPLTVKTFFPIFKLLEKTAHYYFSNINYRTFNQKYEISEPEYVIYNNDKEDTIVCLHGYADKGTLFRHLPSFLPDYRIIALYYPTHNYRKIFTLDEITEYVNGTLINLNVKYFTLTGFSLGGLIATKYAYKYPGRVKRLLLLNSLPDLLFDRTKKIMYKLVNRFVKNNTVLYIVSLSARNRLIRRILPFVGMPKDTLDELRIKYYSIYGTFIDVVKNNLTEIYNSLEMQKTVVLFTDDSVIHYRNAYKRAVKLNGNLITFEEGGHAEKHVFWENVAKIISDGR